MLQDGKAPPPKPASKDIHIDCTPELTAHVRSFAGFPVCRRITRELRRLHDALGDDCVQVARGCGVIAVYDPPTQLEDRHNEVGFRV